MEDSIIKKLIVEFARNGNKLSDEQLNQILTLLESIDSVKQKDCFNIMSIASMLSFRYEPVEDNSNIKALCYYYCNIMPTHCSDLVTDGKVKNMNEFFTLIKDYCIELLKEES